MFFQTIILIHLNQEHEITFDGNQVLEWINDQEPYTLHKYKRKRFKKTLLPLLKNKKKNFN
jgi:hypothetical protein